MANDGREVKVGDLRQGTGGLGVLVRVDSIDGGDAQCTLTRSGKPKAMKVATLRSKYTLLERDHPARQEAAR